MRRNACLAVLLLALYTSKGQCYVDSCPTLGHMCYAATDILILKVKKVSRENRAILYEPVTALKGRRPEGLVRHSLRQGNDQRAADALLDWAEPGKIAVCLATAKVTQTFTGEAWYECAKGADDWWTLTRERAELALAYVGPVGKFGAQVGDIVAGKEVVITAVRHRGQADAVYDPVALRSRMRGPQYPVWRLRASLKMPGVYTTLTVPNCPWVVGPGAGVKDDVQRLIDALAHADPLTRAEAADELALLGGEARAAGPALRLRLADDDPGVRVHAAGAMLCAGVDAAEAVEALTRLIAGPAPGIRRDAARFLGEGPSQAVAIVPVLVRALSDKEDRVRRAAVESVGQLGKASAAAVPDLLKLLDDAAVAEEAAQALGAVGRAAEAAAPALIAALRRAKPGTRGPFARALARVAPAAGGPAAGVFLQELKSADERDRWDAVVCFRLLGPAAAEEVPAIAQLLRSPDAGPRTAAARVLADLGPRAVKALPALIAQLEHPEVAARWQALNVLTNMPKEARPAVPLLVANLKHPKADYARAVANALKIIDPMTAAAHGIR
jgi:HEAT repeat protein